ncbi:MAG: hypothetical protein J5814_04675 [Bacteroidaceae bacterium]|nr:hypothetical protein [Bacteroidaceae bacterium]
MIDDRIDVDTMNTNKRMKKEWALGIVAAMLVCAGCASVRDVSYTTERVERAGELQGFPKQGYQGMSIYGDYLVSLQNTGLATLYRLTDSGLERVHQFALASRHEVNHANVADFGNERVDKGDVLPVLYVSQCARQRYEGLKDVCFVERISTDGDPQLVQTIVLDDTDGLFGYALQWVVDNRRKLLIGYGNTKENLAEGNRWRMMTFRLPRLSEGPVVHLRPQDALDNYCIQDLDARFPSRQIGQGACITGDWMLIPVGLGTAEQPSILYVWNLKKKRLDGIYDYQQLVPAEFEDCAPYRGDLLVQTNGMGLVRLVRR